MGREPTKVIWANCRTRSVQAAKETSMATEERAMAMRERRQEKRTLKADGLDKPHIGSLPTSLQTLHDRI